MMYTMALDVIESMRNGHSPMRRLTHIRKNHL